MDWFGVFTLIVTLAVLFRGLMSKVVSDLKALATGPSPASVFSTHECPLVLSVVVFVLLAKARLPTTEPSAARVSTPATLRVLIAATAFPFAWSYYTATPSLLIPTAVVLLPCVGWLVGGRAHARALAIPSLALLISFPLPGAIVNELIFSLQRLVAHFLSAALSWLGTPTVAWGELVVSSGNVFQVIESCAGLGLVTTLLYLVILYAAVVRAPGRRLAVLCLASIPIGLVVNLVRVTWIATSAIADNRAPTSHDLEGLLSMLVGMGGIIVFDRATCRVSNENDSEEEAREQRAPHRPHLSRSRMREAVAILAPVALLTLVVPGAAAHRVGTDSILELPVQLRHRPSERRPLNRTFLGSLHFDEALARRFQFEGHPIEFFAASAESSVPGRSIWSKSTMLPGPGSRVIAQEPRISQYESTSIDTLLVDHLGQITAVLHLRKPVGSAISDAVRATLGISGTPLVEPGKQVVTRISSAVDLATESPSDAVHRLARFLKVIEPALKRVGAVGPSATARGTPTPGR